jgi:hypothetical protein
LRFDIEIQHKHLIFITLQKFGQKTIDILHHNRQDYPEIFIHSFSVGACVWGVCQRMMDKNPSKYSEVSQRVIGQVWDSVSPYSKTLKGIPEGIFPNNIVLQSIFSGVVTTFLKVHRSTTKSYIDAIERFKTNRISSPALFIGSKIDTVASPEFSAECIKQWQARGIEVSHKLFDDSGHVQHYKKYPEEYLKTLEDHWRRVKLFDRR